jgi:rod shape determining protein RodA
MDVGYYGSDRTDRILRERVQDRWMDAYAPVRHLDPVLVLTALALAGLGIAAIYSATSFRLSEQGLQQTFYVNKQLVALVVGLVAMSVAAIADYRWTRTYSPLLYGLALVLLVAVLTPIGTEVNGSQRWINLGGFNLQPSEVAKVSVILALAALLHEQKGSPGPMVVVAGLGMVAVPAALVFLEPDLGTTITFAWVTFVLFLVGGVKARYLLGLAATAIGGAVAAFRMDFIEDYQLERLTAFLDAGNPDLAQGPAFHTKQSLIAIGSGQFGGKGFLEGTQNTLSYVPENHTDFIFTIVGEEFGFFGAVIVLGLFALLMWRGLRIAMMAKDLYGTLVAASVVSLLLLQVFVNVGMTVGIMPVTGIPLPFMSYGGTSLIIWFGLIGLLLNIHMRRFG